MFKCMKENIKAFSVALTFLTNIKISSINRLQLNQKEIERSVIFYSIIGFFYGLIFSGILIAKSSFLNIEIKSCMILFTPLLLNKFFHFDGLCDVFDAFLSNSTPEKRLEILKDSNIGSYALGVSTLLLLTKFFVIKTLLNIPASIPFFIIIPVLSRLNLVLLSYRAVYPRETGTGKFIIGNISSFVLFLSLTVSLLLISLVCLYFDFNKENITVVFLFVIISILFSCFVRRWSYQKIKGITGDVLGASVELTEFILMITLLFFSGIIK